ncbi:hypothetical protein VPH35_055807 [Triticum aestivum]
MRPNYPSSPPRPHPPPAPPHPTPNSSMNARISSPQPQRSSSPSSSSGLGDAARIYSTQSLVASAAAAACLPASPGSPSVRAAAFRRTASRRASGRTRVLKVGGGNNGGI